MDPMLHLALAAALSLVMAGAWLTQRITGSSGWVDAFWSFGVGGCAVAAALMGPQANAQRAMLVAGLAALWGLRLGGYIAMRTRGAGEDPRYAALMAEWGAAAPRRLFLFLQVQALAGLVLVASLGLAARNPAPLLRPLDVLALLLAVVAIAGAALADAQLHRYRSAPSRPAGGVCEEGLWRYSRHPNYFFEWLGWCAVPLLAIDLSGAYPIGWAALAAPVLMYVLLVHVSGIPPLEAHMLRSRGAAYAAVQARVSAFFPAPPRSRTHPEQEQIGGAPRQ